MLKQPQKTGKTIFFKRAKKLEIFQNIRLNGHAHLKTGNFSTLGDLSLYIFFRLFNFAIPQEYKNIRKLFFLGYFLAEKKMVLKCFINFKITKKTCSAAIRFCIHNIVLHTVFGKWFSDGSVFGQNVVIGSVNTRLFCIQIWFFLLWFFNKRISIVYIWGFALHRFN